MKRPEVVNWPLARTLAPREVLDLHAGLHAMLARPDPFLRRVMIDYAHRDVADNPRWAASHLHPARRWEDLDPWIASLAGDLAGATTYQVTAEMIDLAEALVKTTPDADDIQEEDLPSPWGFMWLDRPVARPSVEDSEALPPLMMHAVSWARVPALQVTIGETGQTATLPAVRVREWGYNDDLSVVPRPLHLMGQTTVAMTRHVLSPLPELWTVHLIWLLMGMEISTSTIATVGRHGRKRAAALRHPSVRVITLRRPAHGEPEGGHRHVDWSCSWIVRGHWRRAPHGGTFNDGRDRTWIKPYIKGPDGLPLRASDILYRLSR